MSTSLQRKGKGIFYKSMDPLNRIISAEEQLKDQKKAARNEEQNEGDYSPATQESSEQGVAGPPAPEDNSPSEREKIDKMREELQIKNRQIKKLKSAGRKIKQQRDDLRSKFEELEGLINGAQ